MKRALLAAALALSAAGAAAAPENPGVTAAPILQIPMGARALGMAGAFTAVATDASALYYNPAGLSRLSAHEAALTYVSGLADSSLQHLAYGGPLPFSGITGGGYASAGASLLYGQSGKIEVNRTNPDGSFQSAETLKAGSDIVASAGYAERLGATPMEIRGVDYGINHFLGVSGKFVRSTLVERYTASAVTADAGYLVHSPEAGLAFGFSALNVGGKMKFIDEADPLPTTIRAGLAYQAAASQPHSILIALDGDQIVRERRWHLEAGVEYFWFKSYGLRAGYRYGRAQGGLTAGLGWRWQSRFLIDYAWVMGGDLDDAHRLTLSWRFGGVAPALRGQGPKTYIESPPERQRVEDIQERVPQSEPPRRPRSVPRQEPLGVPGWIY